MKCQRLFSGKNKKNISKCRLLKILHSMLSIQQPIATLVIPLPKFMDVPYARCKMWKNYSAPVQTLLHMFNAAYEISEAWKTEPVWQASTATDQPSLMFNLFIPEEDIAVRQGFSLIGSGVEDQISEITIFKFLLHIPGALCLNHFKQKGKFMLLSYDYGEIIQSSSLTPPQKLLNLMPCSKQIG